MKPYKRNPPKIYTVFRVVHKRTTEEKRVSGTGKRIKQTEKID